MVMMLVLLACVPAAFSTLCACRSSFQDTISRILSFEVKNCRRQHSRVSHRLDLQILQNLHR